MQIKFQYILDILVIFGVSHRWEPCLDTEGYHFHQLLQYKVMPLLENVSSIKGDLILDLYRVSWSLI
jgi:hypothetical protein